MNIKTLLRLIGNLCLIVGYCIILYIDFKSGLLIKFLGGLLIMPSLIELKMWDGIIITTFFTIIELTRLFQLISNT